MKNKLTIEQSNRLIELGVSRDIASETEIYDEPWHRAYYAVFTVTDLLNILPKEATYNGVTETLTIIIEPHRAMAGYPFVNSNDVIFYAPELIDALYELTIFCIKNKFE